VSIHADDEYSLKFAVESELDDVVPGDGLAGLVIARYHKTRRRRIAGAVGLFVIFAGIGVPIGVTAAGGGSARSAALRLASFTLQLPQQYELAPATAPACAAAAAPIPRPRVPADNPVAATTPAGCILMLLTPATSVPPRARQVTTGSYHAWLVPSSNGTATLVISNASPGLDLVISESHESDPDLERLVATSLS
jgi:hypothetical protein